MTDKTPPDIQVATLAAGCFWCVEAVLQQLEGVLGLRPGFMGGMTEDPTYREVCMGDTGHAEVIEVRFDPDVIAYGELLNWFWKLHDPTTLNRQGNDVGTQYRSAIFYHSEDQRQAAEDSKAEAGASGLFSDPIVTEITTAETFYEAGDGHHDYYRQNREQSYCRMVVLPKLVKLGFET